jgi:hypothetical protein
VGGKIHLDLIDEGNPKANKQVPLQSLPQACDKSIGVESLQQ